MNANAGKHSTPVASVLGPPLLCDSSVGFIPRAYLQGMNNSALNEEIEKDVLPWLRLAEDLRVLQLDVEVSSHIITIKYAVVYLHDAPICCFFS